MCLIFIDTFRYEWIRYRDINRPSFNNFFHDDSKLIKISKYIRIISSGWLPPEINEKGNALRWMSGTGKFVIMAPDQSISQKLHFEYIGSGPDLHPDDRIKITIGEHLLKTILPTELPL